MFPNHLHKELVGQALQILWTGFDDYCEAFATITQRANRRFEQSDWQGMRRDTVERLDLYPEIVAETESLLKRSLAPAIYRHDIWTDIKTQFNRICQEKYDAEIAGTFYNSVHRKLFVNAGVDPKLTFLTPPVPKLLPSHHKQFFELEVNTVMPEDIRTILSHYAFQTPFESMEEDVRQCAIRIAELNDGAWHKPVRIQMLNAPFYRGMSAYLVGRVCRDDIQSPLVFVLDNGCRGLYVDALLTTSEQLRVLFSFARAYFHVRTSCPRAIVDFLRPLMPEKRIAEIYIGLGYHKHGKTELYSDLLRHQRVCSQDRFDFSPGKHGMVMIAFNMPEDDLIYKLIRDRFDRPKHTTARQVMEKYDYVFKHDRAGRLMDVQTFENLELEECCFTPGLLSNIKSEATSTATVLNGRVLLHHAYVERRVTPLDIYLQAAETDKAEAVIIDYGRAIKDLARINVFPGDMLIKNFGVTRLGRVVFYDYDELCPLLDCNFRKLPQARHYEDELSSEPWFLVEENDVFPEEFTAFLGLPARLRKVFLENHGDLLEPAFWQMTQERIRAGAISHIRPYKEAQRLKRKGRGD